MSTNDLDRRLANFFAAASAEAMPADLLDDVYRVTRRIPQQRGPVARRTAAIRLWWSAPFGSAPSLRTLLIVAILLLTLAASIVYVAGHYRRLPPPYGPAGNGVLVYDADRQLYVLNDDGTSRRLEIGLGHSWGPVFSPDGTKLAFQTQAAVRKPTELWVANADGGDAHSVSGDGTLAGNWGFTWAPDSARIVYASDVGGYAALFVAAADGSGTKRITKPDLIERTYPTWSPRGDLIAYRKRALGLDHVELDVISPEGDGEHSLVAATLSPGAFAGSQWSLDGTRIAYFRKRLGLSSNDIVEIVDLDGSVEVVSDASENSFNPVWSNSGRWMAYARDPKPAVIVDLTTGKRRDLPVNLADCGAYWTPDDRYIVGLGLNCDTILRFPVDDPAAVQHIADGVVGGATVQRLAP